MLAAKPIDILAITESGLDSSICDNDVFITGYDVVGRIITRVGIKHGIRIAELRNFGSGKSNKTRKRE